MPRPFKHIYGLSFLVESHTDDPEQVMQGQILKGLKEMVAAVEKSILDIKLNCEHLVYDEPQTPCTLEQFHHRRRKMPVRYLCEELRITREDVAEGATHAWLYPGNFFIEIIPDPEKQDPEEMEHLLIDRSSYTAHTPEEKAEIEKLLYDFYLENRP